MQKIWLVLLLILSIGEGDKQSLAADEHINVVCECIDLANAHIVYRECGDSWYVSAQT